MRQLRRWKDQISAGSSKDEKLKRISEYITNRFNEALENRIIIHDIDIARWASRAQEEKNVVGFKASETWVKRFKTSYDIVSRKITKFVTKKSLLSKTDLEDKCNTFIENVKYYIERYGVDNVYNSDQSGFQLEFHSGRTLSQKGLKNIEAVIQSTSATIHSYTIQPTISADGKKSKKIKLSDPTISTKDDTSNNNDFLSSKNICQFRQLDNSNIESDADSVSEVSSLSINLNKCRQPLINESFSKIKSISGIFFNL
ncbi:uncharacterized protein LOC112589564 isoform X1 [Harpegnathos saltator]|uniref:uncharacterized protein LOC112589564 isoform X1 n=1 Tax=Harpegnathos saltator TaxID=610380 RepID=UPI000DBEEA6B|nr:uncharacterized protein LOC112589564 isoform X1 [Harpegnathos saltator]XP_025159179.1 uncharacterized protein LOC112589564 isoform X1 [Harpegnathos saltator]